MTLPTERLLAFLNRLPVVIFYKYLWHNDRKLFLRGVVRRNVSRTRYYYTHTRHAHTRAHARTCEDTSHERTNC